MVGWAVAETETVAVVASVGGAVAVADAVVGHAPKKPPVSPTQK